MLFLMACIYRVLDNLQSPLLLTHIHICCFILSHQLYRNMRLAFLSPHLLSVPLLGHLNIKLSTLYLLFMHKSNLPTLNRSQSRHGVTSSLLHPLRIHSPPSTCLGPQSVMKVRKRKEMRGRQREMRNHIIEFLP